MREPTPAVRTERRVQPRPALPEVIQLPVRALASDVPAVPEPAAPPGRDLDGVHGHADAVASIEAQVRQVESMLDAMREGVGSLARASVQLSREVDRALQEASTHTRPAPRATRPSSAHPAQAAVERAALLEAVENRAVIEQAKGMLMLKHRCDAEAAFGLLVEISRREHRKVRDIAGDIVRSGSAPRRVVDVTDAAVSAGRVAEQIRVR